MKKSNIKKTSKKSAVKSVVKNIDNSGEQAIIVEYSFNPKSSCFVVRFLDGSSFVLKTSNLPKKVQFNKHLDWESTQLLPSKNGLFVPINSQTGGISIEHNIIRTKGNILT